MSKSSNKPIDNAAEIIEKFGGIRPMSAKINVAVTTIQGWKKRGVIPYARKEIIFKAALEHDIDLSDFFADAPAVKNIVEEVEEVEDVSDGNVENTEIVVDSAEKSVAEKNIIDLSEVSEVKEVKKDVKKTDEFALGAKRSYEARDKRDKGVEHKNFTEISMQTERKTVYKSVFIALTVVLLLIAAFISMMWPSIKELGERGSRLAALESDVANMKDAQSMFKGFVPENWSKQLSELKQQVSKAKSSVDNTISSVKGISKDLVTANGLEDRVVKLQSYVSEIANESGIYSLLSRFDGMENTTSGKATLDNAVLEISSILAGVKGKDDSYINNALNLARSQSSSVQQTLGDVPQNELKAAAMLLALTQVRSALNRSDEAFDNDLALLMNMVGDDDVELKKSLDKLSPHAKTGILSPSGLQNEFRSVAGEVVAASLSGEDVSFSEKISARMNDILQVEKDGELLSGTKTQAKLKKADKMMENGNLDSALTYLKKNLNSKELKPLKPWLKQAEAVINSAKVKKALEQAIELNVGRGYLGGSQLLNDQ